MYFFDDCTILYCFQYLADIEDHLNITIQQVEPDMKVPCDEFDGKVVYGEKRKQVGTGYQVYFVSRFWFMDRRCKNDDNYPYFSYKCI